MKYLKATLLLTALLSLWVAAPASAEVKWWTKAEWGPSTLEAGGKGQLVIYTRNYGSSPSYATGAKIVDQLPAGVLATAVKAITPSKGPGASCSGVGSSTITCSMSGGTGYVAGFDAGLGGAYGGIVPEGPTIAIDLRAAPGVSGAGTNKVTVSGGGDYSPEIREDEIPFGTSNEGFGINPATFTNDLFDVPFPEDGQPFEQAGGHPGDFRLGFDFNESFKTSAVDPGQTYLAPIGGRVRNVEVTLPRGLIGNPEAVPKCKPLEFLKKGQDPQQMTGCPPNTQLGTIDVQLGDGNDGTDTAAGADLGINFNRTPIYNLVPPKGTPADFGFQFGEFAVGHIYASLDAAHNYAIKSTSPYNSQLLPVRSVRVNFWGVPGDPAHDLFRGRSPVLQDNGLPDPKVPPFGAPFTAPIKPFFTNPFDCGVDNGGFEIRVDSWKDPGTYTNPLETPNHLNVNGCDDQRMRFHPDIALQPTSRAAGGPTGLKVSLEVPQRDQTVEDFSTLYDQSGDLHAIDTPPIKKAVVRLPEGMTLSTSAAQGLTGCTAAQIGLGTNDPVSCPDSSQYGELAIHTPLLPKDEPMHGYIYIARQGDNPFHNFLALYLVIEDQNRGLRIKIPGRIDLDPQSGQITTTFDDLPQFPVSDLELSLKGGVRAGLVNPTTCGQKQISASFYSWADPQTPISKTSSFDISQKGDGSPCVANLGQRPFAPQMSAGTESNSAGAYSPFHLRLTRADDDQEFSQLNLDLPPGLLPKIAGIAECSDAGIAKAISRTAAGDGALEQSDPSCPASAQIGTSDVGSGVGQVITYIPGKVYLAGPYKGAPLSVVVITSILAGPYDLGVIAVRSGAYVDQTTGQASVKSDPFPQIYQGIPVRIRDVRVNIDRPQTMRNPTSCDPMSIDSQVTGTGGDLGSTADDSQARASSRYQAANCSELGFKPTLSLRLSGPSQRGSYPKLQAVFTPRPGDANTAFASVALPHSEFLENAHLNNICTRVQYATQSCPADSVYGYATAYTPLLDQPLKGPVYLRSSSHLLPDLVADLNGQVGFDIAARIDSVNGGIRSTFETVPDAPVSKFVLSMKGGSHGLLQNSRDICKGKTPKATAKFTAHNAKKLTSYPKLKADCAAKRKKQKGQRAHRGR